MFRYSIHICAPVALIILCCFPSLAQNRSSPIVSPGQMEIKALQGLDSIKVEVEGDDRVRKQDMEQRLSAGGLRVVNVAARGRLLLTLSRSGGMTLVRVRLLRLASMTCRDDLFYALMWEREKIVRQAAVNNAITELIDLFAADYKSINRR
jgi:hypothetical protein